MLPSIAIIVGHAFAFHLVSIFPAFLIFLFVILRENQSSEDAYCINDKPGKLWLNLVVSDIRKRTPGRTRFDKNSQNLVLEIHSTL